MDLTRRFNLDTLESFRVYCSKKPRCTGDDGQFLLEKHKIFLYKEDFDKFEEAFKETLTYIREKISTQEYFVANFDEEKEK